MGMYDHIRVELEQIPQRPAHINESLYRDEIEKLTSGRAQVKDLSRTMDDYIITSDGRLLIITKSELNT